MLRESYGVMRKRYEEVEQLVDQKTEIRRTASAERDWAGVPEALRARDVLIERALKAFERHEKMVVGLRDQLVRWGRAPPPRLTVIVSGRALTTCWPIRAGKGKYNSADSCRLFVTNS